VMDYLHHGRPSRAPQPPAGVVRQQVAYQPELEAARGEWFVAGTETPLVTLVQDNRRTPRILYPGEASTIALDPDIPDAIQRVFFQAQGGRGLTWQLDGVALSQATADYAWRPVPGQHQLALVDERAQTVAVTHFQVRGSAHQ